MKILIYGLQSSGASLFTFWLSQQLKYIGIIDIYFNVLAPNINCENVVAKCTINELFKFEEHVDSFKPDKKILFVRNPFENYLSLKEKIYSGFGGEIDKKFKLNDFYIENKKNYFDYVITYEDFLMKKINFELKDFGDYNFPRSINSLIDFNNKNNLWCKENYKKLWGTGNIHMNQLSLLNTISNFKEVCKLYDF